MRRENERIVEDHDGVLVLSSLGQDDAVIVQTRRDAVIDRNGAAQKMLGFTEIAALGANNAEHVQRIEVAVVGF